MDFFSRNALLMLFGSSMLLGLGFVGLFVPEIETHPGLSNFLSGRAPLWIAAAGAAGISSILVVLLVGPKPEERHKKNWKKKSDPATEVESPDQQSAGTEVASKALSASGNIPESETVYDATMTFIRIEVILRRGEKASPALGSAVPPSAVCNSLLESRDLWISSSMDHQVFKNVEEGMKKWKSDAATVKPAVPVRGRKDGEASIYRMSLLVHLPPGTEFGETPSALQILGKLNGDRYFEITMCRIPEEADTFVSEKTLAEIN